MADLAQIGFKVDTSELQQANQQLTTLGNTASQAGSKTKVFADGFDKANQSVAGSTVVFDGLKNTLAALGVYLTGKQVLDYAETYSNLTDKLQIAIGSAKDLVFYQQQIYQVAQQSRSSLESTYNIFERLSKVKDKIGISQQDVLNLTQIVNMTAQLSGQDAFSTDQSIRQFTQALAEDDLKGLGLSAVLRANQRLAQAIGEGLGFSVGEVRRLGEQGKLTADQVVQSILSQSGRIQSEFRQLSLNPSDAWVALKNSITKYIGEADRSLGVTKAIADAMIYLSNHLNILEGAIAVLGIIALPKLVSGLTGLLGALTGLSTANPFALIGTGILAATGYLVAHRDEIKPLEDSYATLGDFGVAIWNDILGAGDNAATQTQKSFSVHLPQILSDVKEFVNAYIASFELMGRAIGAIFGAIYTTVRDSLNVVVAPLATLRQNLLESSSPADFVKRFQDSITQAAGKIQNPFTAVADQIKKDFKEIRDTDYVGQAFKTVTDAIEGLAKKYQSAAEKIHNKRQQIQDDSRLVPTGFDARYTASLPSADFVFAEKDLDRQIAQFTQLRAAADKSTDSYNRLTASIKAYQAIKDKNYGLKAGEFDILVAKEAQKNYLEETATKALQHTEAYEKLAKETGAATAQNKKLVDSLSGGVDAYNRSKIAVEAENQVIQTGLDLGDRRAQQLKEEIELNLKRKESIEKIAQVQGEVADRIQSSFEDAIFEGKGLDEVLQSLLKDLAKIAFQEATRGLFRSIVGGVFSIFTSGLGGGGAASAKGNVFSNGSLMPFADGGVVGSPTIFPMANGGTGLMGEAGPEAILPLRRGANGALGVMAAGSGGNVVNQVVNVTVQSNGDASQDQALGDRIAMKVRNMLKADSTESIRQQLRPGNILNPNWGLRG